MQFRNTVKPTNRLAELITIKPIHIYICGFWCSQQKVTILMELLFPSNFSSIFDCSVEQSINGPRREKICLRGFRLQRLASELKFRL